jgi:hypothetical protein
MGGMDYFDGDQDGTVDMSKIGATLNPFKIANTFEKVDEFYASLK